MRKTINYSVVMSVYKNDHPSWVDEAIKSILNQSRPTDNFVIVRDGKVGQELDKLLAGYEANNSAIKLVKLEANVGAGRARTVGVEHTKHELVGIMDADDISLKNRFKNQLEQFKNKPELSLVGGQISEFEHSTENIKGYRKVPLDLDDIIRFARYRSPINHVTIMFKKSAFFEAGGYPNLTRAEDYYMVSSLLAMNHQVINVPETLVNCRIGDDNLKRRKNWHNLRENLISRHKIYKLGIMSPLSLCLSSAAQVMMFLMPSSLIGWVFRLALRSKGE